MAGSIDVLGRTPPKPSGVMTPWGERSSQRPIGTRIVGRERSVRIWVLCSGESRKGMVQLKPESSTLIRRHSRC